MITPWGYEVESLEPMLSVAEFRAIMPGLSATDEQVESVLSSVSAAIRDYCGWHVSPSLECTYYGAGEEHLLVLPAMGVTNVASLQVTFKGETKTYSDYEWVASGMVRIPCELFPDAWRSAKCVYTAGFGSESVGQVVAQIAGNALVAAPGVSDERVGNVSISYNKTGDGITGGVSLLPRDYALLAPYRLVRAW